MTYAECMAEAKLLKGFLEKRGVRVSIELQTDAKGTWSFWSKRLEMSHHVVSRPSQGNTPFLRLVKKGRPDVPGPLCNGYGGFDEVYRIITMGIANHSGAGGPLTIDGVTVPKDNGRYHIWGTEYEGGLEEWTPSMHDFMSRSNAGILDYLAHKRGATVGAHCEHSTWAPRRKIDRLNYTRDSGIARIRAVTTTGGGIGGGMSPVIVPTPAPSRPKNSNAHRTYATGEVKRIQTILTDLGYYTGNLDDDYGPWTEAAVLAYQRAQLHGNLVKDGDWGPATEAHYQWVRTLQETMNRWKGYDVRVDGDHRTYTKTRVADLMRRNLTGAYAAAGRALGYSRVIADGVPGPVFCKMLAIPTHPNL